MRVLELFAGVGGLALGLERAGMETVGFVEIDEDCRHWLKAHWPDVPQWSDVREVSGDGIRASVGPVDVVAGGFPCQPHSVAGSRKGTDDERHLWPEFIRVVRDLRPTWVVAENVPGIRTSAADEVIGDLEESGYAVWPTVVGACDVGAPHIRRRVFFLARLADCDRDTVRHVEQRMPYGWAQGVPDKGQAFPRGNGATVADGDSEARRGFTGRDAAGLSGREGPSRNESSRRRDGTVGNAVESGRKERHVPEVPRQTEGWDASLPVHSAWPAPPGCEQHEWEEPRLAHAHVRGGNARVRGVSGSGEGQGPSDALASDEAGGRPRSAEPAVGPAADGVSEGLVELSTTHRRTALKAVGNAVVPPVAEVIGRAVVLLEKEIRRARDEAPELVGEDR